MQSRDAPADEFLVTSTFEDALRNLYNLVDGVVVFFLLLWLSLLAASIASLVRGEWPHGAWLSVSLFGGVFIGFFVRTYLKVPPEAERTIKVCLGEAALAVELRASRLVQPWSEITLVEEKGGMLYVAGPSLQLTLPIYRMSAQQVASVRGRLAVLNLQRPRRRAWLTRLVLVAAGLTLLIAASVECSNREPDPMRDQSSPHLDDVHRW